MGKILKNEAVTAKVETTAGTAENNTGADYVRVMEPAMALEGNRVIERGGIAAGAQGAYKPLHGGTLRNLSCGWEVAAGTNTSPIPEHDALYQAVGFALDATTDPTVATYSLQSVVDNTKTATIDYFQDGLKRSMRGSRANAFSIEAAVGALLRCDATFVGKDNGGASDTATPTLSVHGTDPLKVTNVALSVGGTTNFIVESVAIDMGLDTQTLGDMTEEDGYALPRIVNRAITVTINPEKENVSVRDWFAALKADTNIQISLDIGTSFQTESTGKGRVRINLPRCVVTDLTDGDRSGVRTNEITLMAYRSDAGDDEMTLQFD